MASVFSDQKSTVDYLIDSSFIRRLKTKNKGEDTGIGRFIKIDTDKVSIKELLSELNLKTKEAIDELDIDEKHIWQVQLLEVLNKEYNVACFTTAIA